MNDLLLNFKFQITKVTIAHKEIIKVLKSLLLVKDFLLQINNLRNSLKILFLKIKFYWMNVNLFKLQL